MDEGRYDGWFVIGWRSNVTGLEGQGTKSFPYLACREMCEALNRRFIGIKHFPLKADDARHASEGE